MDPLNTVYRPEFLWTTHTLIRPYIPEDSEIRSFSKGNTKIHEVVQSHFRESIEYIDKERDTILKFLMQNRKISIHSTFHGCSDVNLILKSIKKSLLQSINKLILMKYFDVWNGFYNRIEKINKIQNISIRIDEIEALKKIVSSMCKEENYITYEIGCIRDTGGTKGGISKIKRVHLVDIKSLINDEELKLGNEVKLPYRFIKAFDSPEIIRDEYISLKEDYELLYRTDQQRDVFLDPLNLSVKPDGDFIYPDETLIYSEGTVTYISYNTHTSQIVHCLEGINKISLNLTKFCVFKNQQFRNLLIQWIDALKIENDHKRHQSQNSLTAENQEFVQASPAYKQLELKRKKRVKTQTEDLIQSSPSSSNAASPSSKEDKPQIIKELDDPRTHQNFLRIFNQSKEMSNLKWRDIEVVALALGFSIEKKMGHIRNFKFGGSDKIISQPIKELTDSVIKQRLDQKHKKGYSEKSSLNDHEINSVKWMFEKCGFNPHTVQLKQFIKKM